MSTRASIHFTSKGHEEIEANVYRHSDGYPDTEYGVPADLDRFFQDVEKQTGGDTRFNDPSYLAAKYVVWQAGQYAGDKKRPLSFLSVGVQVSDPGDIEYIYTVESQPQGRPVVTWKEVS
jgi:hypothetical protein